jgi:hypothetical protein
VQSVLDETCDDRNTNTLDACSNRCRSNKPLSDHLAGCSGVAQSRSGTCAAAVRRYCAALDGSPGGLIQETNAEKAMMGMGCFGSGATRFSGVPAADVKAFNDECSSPQTAPCMTAARDFCKSKNGGFEFGMVQENNTSNDVATWLVVCAPAQRVTVSLTNLANEVGGNCSASQVESLAQSCVSAAHRYCQDRVGDQALGGGMLMNVSDTSKIQLACFKFGVYGDVPID